MIDRVVYRSTWVALIVSVATGFTAVGMQTAYADAGTAFGLAFMVLFFIVSVPLHGALALVAVVRGFLGGGRTMRWVYAYLLATVVAHAVVAARMGGLDDLVRHVERWQRAQDEPAQVALEKALVQAGNAHGVKTALAAGANPNGTRPGSPLTYLVSAAMVADADVVDALLDGGADPDLASPVGLGDLGNTSVSPLDAAAFSSGRNRLAAVRRLLDAGADAQTSLIRLGACRNGDLGLLELAASSRAPDVVDPKGNGCLHHAARAGREAMVARLLADGADADEANSAGLVPLDLALARRHYRVALLLARSGAVYTARRVLPEDPGNPDLEALRHWMETTPPTE